MEEKILGDMKYLISYPEGFNESEKYPVLFFLHGRGATNLQKSYINTLPWRISKRIRTKEALSLLPPIVQAVTGTNG